MNPNSKTRQKKKSTAENFVKTWQSNLLHLSEMNIFQGFVENLPVLFYAASPNPPYSTLYVSPAFEIFGYPIEDWCDKPEMWMSVIHPNDRERVLEATEAAMKSGGETDYEYRIVGGEGEIFWVRDRGRFVRNQNGELFCWQGVIMTICKRKKAESDLSESERRYRQMFEKNRAVKLIIDGNTGEIFDANPAAWEYYGYSASEFKEKNIAEINTLSFEEISREMKLAIKEKRCYFNFRHRLASGEIRDVEVHSSPIENQGRRLLFSIVHDITERKAAETALKKSEENYRDLFENANDLIYTHDLQGNFTSLNRAGEIITGYSRDEAVKMNISQVVAPEYFETAKQMTKRKIEGEKPAAYELQIVAKDGRRVSLELSTRLILQDNQPIGVQGIGRDITKRKQAEEALIKSEQSYRFLSEGIMHQVWTATPDGGLDYISLRTLRYFGKTFEEMCDDKWVGAVHPEDLPGCVEKWTRALKTGENYEVEFRLRRGDGTYRWHLGRAVASYDEKGNVLKWFGTNTDIDDQKAAEAKLNFYALHDALTDLPNRAQFMMCLGQAIERCRKNSTACFAVLYLDLDRFKIINDSLGHVIGDKLLIAIAERLKRTVRPGDVVARLGGDEFTVLLKRADNEEGVAKIAERLQKEISKAFQLDNYEVYTSASIGVVISDTLSRKPEEILRDADAAMYQAKASGKARYVIFDREMHERNLNLLQLETDLRRAVERNEFEVFYQPIVSLDTGKIVELEALIRWRHPQRGLISPFEFICSAEETGLIVPIGNWILAESCRQIGKWHKNIRQARDLPVSVNLSAKQLTHPQLTAQIKETLARNKIAARHLKLEVTESVVMEHRETALSVLNELNELGIALSTDDFGTGYSSLSYLHQFPFKRLKIDRSFVSEMENDAKSEAIVKTILTLGQHLNIEAVAEGIETESQLEKLKSFGCSLGQGYLFSRPATAEEIEQLLLDDVYSRTKKYFRAEHEQRGLIELKNVQ